MSMDSGKALGAEIPAFRLINAVFCEDIRREDNGKDMLLGVYGGDIVIARCPIRVGVSLWLQYVSAPAKAGETGIHLRLRFEGHDEPVSQIGLPFMEEGETTLALRGMPVAINGSGVLLLEYCLPGQDWVEIARKRVTCPDPAAEASSGDAGDT
ncbi:hypothetical protein [Saliniramus sp.]|uniref:hypothetical protein n=1 Tax=Saliniramus sp. TaxID=2986772 RepID=UPI002C101574|nr:hypothetical protein [Saliniramus sp.]HMB11451.1 hypothetical protein [Saliniramus sp.]